MLEQITTDLITDLDGLAFGPPVTHVYNPLLYARPSWDRYCGLYGKGRREVVFVGMNPGPWGMAQTGVPFGEVAHVREWLKIEEAVGKPANEHPKRQVLGFDCPRSEVSGRRVWGWAKRRFEHPDAFFERFFVYNYCPLSFMEGGGRNRIPEKLPKAERTPLFAACDRALLRVLEQMQPRVVIGIGAFARKRLELAIRAAQDRRLQEVTVQQVLHPSPANPRANSGWEKIVEEQLTEMNLL
jgi:single-strand selective monofunctional uracil DNA glycosylase